MCSTVDSDDDVPFQRSIVIDGFPNFHEKNPQNMTRQGSDLPPQKAKGTIEELTALFWYWYPRACVTWMLSLSMLFIAIMNSSRFPLYLYPFPISTFAYSAHWICRASWMLIRGTAYKTFV